MATLPLLRGAHPTHLILAYRIAGKTNIRNHPHVAIPSLSKVVELSEMVAAAGAFVGAKVSAIALNTHHLNESEAQLAIEQIQAETGLLCTDPVRLGASRVVKGDRQLICYNQHQQASTYIKL